MRGATNFAEQPTEKTRPPHGTLLAVAVLCVWLLGVTVEPALVAPHESSLEPTFALQLADALQLVLTEEKEWYERGVWPLVGAVAVLIVTNAAAVLIVYFQSSRSFRAMLKQRKIEMLSASLSEFYNPLLALLDINREIFSQTGPPSFPREEPARSAAARIWRETRKRLLTNNLQIETILRTKTHHILSPDSLDKYRRLLLHVAMYDAFQTVETDIYADFQFPADIRAHVETQRGLVLDEFKRASRETI